MTTGIAFPLTLDKSRGNLLMASEGELIKGHILSWLQTQPRERVMRPQYGMRDPLFNSASDISIFASEVQEGLRRYIPDIDFQVYGSINDAGEAVLSIFWEDESITLRVSL
ncbi:Gene 25-like lysozyme [Nostoc sp. PCC 7524]|uniref:lysozyme n=1 Tax=Nostoc sp. (strain ATCC 29411 / PCC 7524) TaxID=28072 RepID=UPI00029F4C8B|nr:lysozyme [Nostoc sp. PCC 7524]AFY49017.1 Gene 25-like lysozyme [Nostoc sp. PCC 7524]